MARKVADETVLRDDASTIDTDLLVEPKARELIFLLATFPDAVRMALKISEPSTIVTYCFRYIEFTPFCGSSLTSEQTKSSYLCVGDIDREGAGL